jgi:hypothetical protein
MRLRWVKFQIFLVGMGLNLVPNWAFADIGTVTFFVSGVTTAIESISLDHTGSSGASLSPTEPELEPFNVSYRRAGTGEVVRVLSDARILNAVLSIFPTTRCARVESFLAGMGRSGGSVYITVQMCVPTEADLPQMILRAKEVESCLRKLKYGLERLMVVWRRTGTTGSAEFQCGDIHR